MSRKAPSIGRQQRTLELIEALLEAPLYKTYAATVMVYLVSKQPLTPLMVQHLEILSALMAVEPEATA